MKKRSADHKKYVYGTGGGPSKEPATDEFDNLLKDILPEKQIEGMISQYDSDFISTEEKYEILECSSRDLSPCASRQPSIFKRSEQLIHSQTLQQENDTTMTDCLGLQGEATLSTSNNICISTPKYSGTQNDGVIEKDFETWEKYTPVQLKTCKNKKLCLDTGKAKQSSWTKLAELKAKWSESKMKQELEFAKTEHLLRVANMKELHELQIKTTSEKHNLEMRVLQESIQRN
ncbi:uncharacterized protein LOC118741521 [Rhagoletis pomonella]|uniref:uncharacterized protein LOC118741521 n=1 Tax=Rhagoletis pomonella TaxID=28610 RepID=UPI001782CD9D|nr:uncharacterized protein LOC118741521 [Rhagoletis pomonella]